MEAITFGIVGVVVFICIVMSINIVRPVEVRLVERFGKYVRTLNQGLSFIIPFIESVIQINITEQMVDVEPQTVITKDKLNVSVDAVVYFKINDAQKSIYNVDDHRSQLVSLSRTTLRAVIGKMTLTEANESRDKINTEIETILDKETVSYGVEVLRVEIQKLEPPKDVVEAMNNVVKAEQAKIAAKETALALEERANGERMAAIKTAEGAKAAKILEAEGYAKSTIMRAEAEAKALELVNTAANEYFKDNAQILKKLETVERALGNNAKIIMPSGVSLINVLGDLAGLKNGK